MTRTKEVRRRGPSFRNLVIHGFIAAWLAYSSSVYICMEWVQSRQLIGYLGTSIGVTS